MRARGLGYWIGGAGLGALGLIAIFLWVSMVSARPGSQLVDPERAADIVADDPVEPAGGRSNDQDRAPTRPARVDVDLNRLRSQPLAGSDTARESANLRAEGRAADGSAVTETDGDSPSRVLRVDTDGAESEANQPSSTGTMADADRDHSGANVDKQGELDDTDSSTPGRSDGTSKPEADADNGDTSTTAKPVERPTTAAAEQTTQGTARETTTTKTPTTNTTASSATPAPTTVKPPTTKAPTTTASPGGGNQSMEQRVIELTNDARRQAGCPGLVHNDRLRQAAYLHSRDMSDNNYFDHTGLDGSSPGDRIARQGYRFRGWAENIAWGYRTPEAVVEGWMNSTGHRENILNCSLTEIGVGFHNNYWTQNFGIPG